MPLSDHEQRMLDQIESALYAEDPKFASSVRGGTLARSIGAATSAGALLFVLGLAMLVSECRSTPTSTTSSYRSASSASS